VYSLVGKGSEPAAEGHLVIECQVCGDGGGDRRSCTCYHTSYGGWRCLLQAHQDKSREDCWVSPHTALQSQLTMSLP